MGIYGKRGDGTFGIDDYSFDDACEIVAKLNKRAKRTGAGCLGIERVATETHQVGVDTGLGYEKRAKVVAVVRITGTVPKIAGHDFVARIEHTEAGNLLSRAPGHHGTELPEAMRTAAPTCDHCKTARRRNETFVLRSDAGQLVRVGRQCLADFLRTEDALDAVKLWKLLETISAYLGDEDEWSSCGGRQVYISTAHFMACVVATVRDVGWKSGKSCMDGEQSTSSIAQYLASQPPSDPGRRREWEAGQPTDADRERAAEILAWAKGLRERADLIDYLHNVCVSASLEYLGKKNAGVLASAYVAHARELEQEIARRKRAEKGESCHVGTVGKRQLFENLTVTRVRFTENEWGTKTIIALEDAEGNDLTWFASGAKSYEAGDVVRGKATVKAHGEYKGRPQTTLSRCDFDLVHAAAKAS